MSRFNCPTDGCVHSYTNRSHLLKHLRIRHPYVRPHKCDDCGLSYSTHLELKHHKQEKHSQKRLFCRVTGCVASFTEYSHLHRHMREAHENAYCCEKCNLTFSTWTDLHNHNEASHTEGRFVCTIDNCNKSYSLHSAMRTHQKNCHTTHLLFGCDRCTESFSTQQEMFTHKLAAHYPAELVCELCLMPFDFMCVFDDHYQRKHATYDEKIAFSRIPANRYCQKLYLLADVNLKFFKIGITGAMICTRIKNLRTQYKFDLKLVECWVLPEKYDKHYVYAHQLENRLVLDLVCQLEYNFVGEHREYFYLKEDSTTELIEIAKWINANIHRQDWSIPHRQIKDKSNNVLYMIYSEKYKLGKIGYTTYDINKRLSSFNTYEHTVESEGNFIVLDSLPLPHDANILELKASVNDALILFHENFKLKKHEYFHCDNVLEAQTLFNTLK